MKKRILFVDDEPNILTALRRSLRRFRREWEMVFAQGGAAALEHCAAAPFDVVVSDARMPDMEGYELLSDVMTRYPDTIRIILSGQCSRKSTLKCVAVAHQFLSKPCDPETLKSTVQGVCRMRGAFRDGTVRRAVSGVQRLPSQARVYREFADLVQSPNASMAELAAVVAQDVGMTAKVVQLVSSGFFGSPQRVISAAQAAELLGLETLRALFASSAAFRPCSDGHREEELRRLTDHSLTVGDAAKEIAATLTDDPRLIGDAHLAGVLHQVGTLACAGRDGPCSPEPNAAAGRQGRQAANSRNGTAKLPDDARPDPGGYLLGLWGLPDTVVQAVAYHRIPDACPEEVRVPLIAVHAAGARLARAPPDPKESWYEREDPLR